jgi:hypothetical protein
MPSGQGLADVLSGAAGAPVNRPQLNAFVANSQAMNGLHSAQTEEALLNAQRAQDEQVASGQLEDAFMQAGSRPAQAHLMAVAARMHAGSAVNAMDMFKAYNASVLGDPSKLGSPDQTAAQQAISGKVAEPVPLPNNFTTLPGTPPVTPQQSTQGAAQTAQTKALTGLDVARAEDEHAKAKNAGTAGLSPLSPAVLDMAARVVMADPSKMSSYAGYGASGQATKNAINSRIADLLNQSGMTADDMITQRAVGKASVGAAGQAAKQQQTLDAFIPLIRANGDRITQLLDQMDAAGGAGIDEPIVNSYERMLGRQLNSDDLTELHSVFTGYQSEVGRLLAAGPSMNGVISDHARDLVNSMAPENMSASGARRVINRIDTEVGIRRQGVHNSINEAAAAQGPVISHQQPGNVPAPPNAASPTGVDLPPGFHALN